MKKRKGRPSFSLTPNQKRLKTLSKDWDDKKRKLKAFEYGNKGWSSRALMEVFNVGKKTANKCRKGIFPKKNGRPMLLDENEEKDLMALIEKKIVEEKCLIDDDYLKQIVFNFIKERSINQVISLPSSVWLKDFKKRNPMLLKGSAQKRENYRNEAEKKLI